MNALKGKPLRRLGVDTGGIVRIRVDCYSGYPKKFRSSELETPISQSLATSKHPFFLEKWAN
jgi:hypothetical protein